MITFLLLIPLYIVSQKIQFQRESHKKTLKSLKNSVLYSVDYNKFKLTSAPYEYYIQ